MDFSLWKKNTKNENENETNDERENEKIPLVQLNETCVNLTPYQKVLCVDTGFFVVVESHSKMNWCRRFIQKIIAQLDIFGVDRFRDILVATFPSLILPSRSTPSQKTSDDHRLNNIACISKWWTSNVQRGTCITWMLKVWNAKPLKSRASIPSSQKYLIRVCVLFLFNF